MNSSILPVSARGMFSSLKQGFVELFLVAVPKVAAGAATLIVNAALLRYFGPEQFAIYALCVTGILLTDAIFGAAVDLGVLRLVPLYQISDSDRALAIQKSALLLKLVPAGVIMVVLLAFSRQVSRFLFHQDGFSFLIFLSALSAIGLLSLRSTQAYLQVERRFSLYGALDWLHNALKFGGIAALLWLNRVTVPGILLFYSIAPICAFALGISFFGPRFFDGPSSCGRLRRKCFGMSHGMRQHSLSQQVSAGWIFFFSHPGAISRKLASLRVPRCSH